MGVRTSPNGVGGRMAGKLFISVEYFEVMLI